MFSLRREELFLRNSRSTKGFLLVALLPLLGCSENVATAPDLDLIDVKPRTLEVLLPFEDFVQQSSTLGGYGSSSDFGSGVVAKEFQGFTAKTIMRFSSYPESLELQGASSGLKFIGGRVVLSFDSVQGPVNEAISLEISATQQAWDVKTVTWDVAVDTVGDRTTWVQAGAESSIVLASGDLNSHLAGDDSVTTFASISMDVDSATVAAWGLGSSSQGMVVASTDSGTSLNLWDAQLVLKAVPFSNPDTIIEVPVPVSDLSFITNPLPVTPEGWLRVGGLPSWRSVMTIKLPEQVEGSIEICGKIGCLFDVAKSQLNLAELILRTRETELGYRPTRPLGIQIRSVLSPSLLPKSPLGDPIGALQGVTIQPEFFSGSEGETAIFSLTDLLEFDSDELSGMFPSETIVLLSNNEGSTVNFASFQGSGSSGSPTLRLLLTVPELGSGP